MSLPVISNNNTSNPMNFTENQQGNAILERLRQQRESGRFCDVILIVQGRQFPAHRNILAASSPYFDQILKMHKVVKEQVTVNCQSSDTFELLLNYMYSGSVVIDKNNVTELLKLSNNFLVSKLKNYCAEYLDRYLESWNCFSVKEIAEKYNMPALLKNACLFLECHINQVLLESEEVLEFPVERARAFLTENNFNISPDAQLKYTLRWVSYNLTDRESNFKDFLSFVKLSQISHRYLQLLLETDPLFQRSEGCLFSTLQALYENNIRLAKFENVYHSLLLKYGGDINIYFNTNPTTVNSDAATTSATYVQNEVIGFETTAALTTQNGNVSAVLTSTHTSGNGAVQMPGSSYTKTEPREQMDQLSTAGDSRLQSISDSCTANFTVSEQVNGATIIDNVNNGAGTVPNLNNNTTPTSMLCISSSTRPPLKLKIKLGRQCGPSSSQEQSADESDVQQQQPVVTAQTVSANRNQEEVEFSAASAPEEGSKKTRRWSMRSNRTSEFTTHNVNNNHSVVKESTSQHAEFDKSANGPSSSNSNESLDLNSEDDSLLEIDLPWDNDGDSITAQLSYQCPHCIYTSNSQSRIELHIQRAHIKCKVYSCNLCDYSCRWNREYYQHMKIHFKGPPFQCDSCSYSGERIQMLLTHRMKHTDERPFKCEDCNYRCRTKTNLIAHTRSHTGERPFVCPDCGRSFAIKSTLDQHLATHSDARPYVCEHCPFSTKYQSHLISHKRIHTGDVFRCEYPDCGYSSPKKSQLAAHLRTHMAIRSHSCSICHRSFIEKSHLVRHERIHLTEKPFKCDSCSYASSRRDKLKEHILKHHTPGSSVQKLYRPRQIAPAPANSTGQVAVDGFTQLRPGQPQAPGSAQKRCRSSLQHGGAGSTLGNRIAKLSRRSALGRPLGSLISQRRYDNKATHQQPFSVVDNCSLGGTDTPCLDASADAATHDTGDLFSGKTLAFDTKTIVGFDSKFNILPSSATASVIDFGDLLGGTATPPNPGGFVMMQPKLEPKLFTASSNEFCSSPIKHSVGGSATGGGGYSRALPYVQIQSTSAQAASLLMHHSSAGDLIYSQSFLGLCTPTGHHRGLTSPAMSLDGHLLGLDRVEGGRDVLLSTQAPSAAPTPTLGLLTGNTDCSSPAIDVQSLNGVSFTADGMGSADEPYLQQRPMSLPPLGAGPQTPIDSSWNGFMAMF